MVLLNILRKYTSLREKILSSWELLIATSKFLSQSVRSLSLSLANLFNFVNKIPKELAIYPASVTNVMRVNINTCNTNNFLLTTKLSIYIHSVSCHNKVI